MPKKEYVFKIVVIGEVAVGKTSLIKQFMTGTFSVDYKATMGTDIFRKEIILETGDVVNLTLWDIAGQAIWREYRKVYYQGANGAIVVFDVTRPPTFNSIREYWYQDLVNFLGTQDIPFILIGNKVDLKHLLRVTEAQAEKLAGDIKAMRLIFTSAKVGTNVEEAFKTMAASLVLKVKNAISA